MSRRGDNIHRRKDGRWEGRYKDGYKSNGTIKYSSVYAKTYSECKNKLINAQTNAKQSPVKLKSNKKFHEILSNWLITNQIRLKGATVAKYSQMIETHITPKLGYIKISELNAFEINKFLEDKLKHGGKHAEALSPSYVRTMAIIIEAAINYAVSEGLCLPLKSPINKPTVLKKELFVLNKHTENIIKEKLYPDCSLVSVGVFLALYAGMRIGEVCALRWCDVDFDLNVIHIRHTVSRIQSQNQNQKTKLIIDDPKTTSSARDIPMPTILKNKLLQAYLNRCSEFVVSSNDSFVGTRTFDYQYRNLLKRNNIEVFNFHTLRHSYATRCAESGMDAKTLSILLGHSSSKTSLEIYVHPSIENTKEKLENIFY